MIDESKRPWRYYMESKPITIWQSIVRLFKNGKWMRAEIYMRPVGKGEDGYDEAPYEETFILDRNVYRCKL